MPTLAYDLLKYYFVTLRAQPLGMTFKTRWSKWEQAWRDMAPPRTPPNRYEIYTLLVNSIAESGDTDTSALNSRIPWNQLGHGWVKAYGGGTKSEKACSDIVQYFFDRYMVRSPIGSMDLLLSSSNDFDRSKVTRACQTLATRLQAYKPTSIAICTAADSQRRKRVSRDQIKQFGFPHVLGIVACDGSKTKFLAIEPWPGNNSGTDYGPTVKTHFLAKIEYNAADGVLEYANGVGRWAKARVLMLGAY